MTTEKKICFVTGELYPFGGWGIGRLVHNLLQDSIRRDAATELHVLVPASFNLEAAAVSHYFGGKVTLHRAHSLEGRDPEFGFDGVYPPAWALSATPWHGESMGFMHRLKELERGGLVFDFVEFPDYQGWAFCALHEKKLGRAFGRTEIAVRMHGTAGIIERYERRHLGIKEAGGFELERKALLDADRAVAPLRATAVFHQQFYGFPQSWLDAVTIELPPVVEAAAESRRTRPSSSGASRRPIVFASRIQPIKRPDLFVRGTALFMRLHPEFEGTAAFAAGYAEAHYLRETKALVPRDLKSRFGFLRPTPAERDQLLATGISVICSDYESLNLLAYETSAAGGYPILNASCPAFGEGSPFEDGKSCQKFDGTVQGLARALERAWKAGPAKAVEWKPDQPYWERSEPRPRPKAKRSHGRVSVIMRNYNLGLYLPEALASVAASSYPNVEVIIVDDASTAELDRKLLPAIAQEAQTRVGSVKLVQNTVNLGHSAALNIGVGHASGDYILPLDADDCIGPRFIAMAVEALEGNPDFDVVVPQVAYFERDEDLPEQRFCDYATFLGDVPSLGLVENRFSCVTSLMRRSIFDRFSYEESLTSFEDWDLYLRLALDGGRFLVTNDLQFFYRRRPNSTMRSIPPEHRGELMARIYEALPRPLPPSVHLFGLAIPRPRPLPQAAPRRQPALRHDLIDDANAVLKNIPLVHAIAKRSMAAMGHRLGLANGGVQPLRHELADSLNAALDRLPGVKGVMKKALARRGNP